MAKGGLKMMMRNLSIELAPLGITVNNVAPGAIETPINKKLLSDPKLLEPLLANIPLHRLGQPSDVAGVTAFLASGDADYVTGATFVWTAGCFGTIASSDAACQVLGTRAATQATGCPLEMGGVATTYSTTPSNGERTSAIGLPKKSVM